MQDKGFEIRLAARADTPFVLDIYTPFILDTAVTFESSVPSIDSFWERIRNVMHEAPWLVCEHGGRVVGYAYAGSYRSRDAYRWTRELSVYVSEDHRGMGVASGLYSALIGLLKVQGYKVAMACITLPNPVSARFHERMGFHFVGAHNKVGHKLGRYHDVGWWELLFGDLSAPAGPIIPLSDAISSPPGRNAIIAGQSRISAP